MASAHGVRTAIMLISSSIDWIMAMRSELRNGLSIGFSTPNFAKTTNFGSIDGLVMTGYGRSEHHGIRLIYTAKKSFREKLRRIVMGDDLTSWLWR